MTGDIVDVALLSDLADPSTAGGKGAGLRWLADQGARTPVTFVVPPGRIPDLRRLNAPAYAVRSSANVEDGSDASFAGVFLTLLDVSPSDLRAAVEAVRESRSSGDASVYANKVGMSPANRMSVLIQEMVRPVVSGVVFTRNPITGLNEAVLEAVSGRGDRLVADGVTPDRWVRRWGRWTDAPGESALPDSVAVAIVEEATSIAEDFGRPADLEWVWDGQDVWWLQIRPITGIDDVTVYSNRISKEVMPGLIKPLVWSVNVPMVNGAWIQLFTEAIGDNDLEPDDLARSFAYRSYFNMGTIGGLFEQMGMPRDSLELLLGLPEGPDKPTFKPTAATLRKLPRLVAFAAGKSRYGANPTTLLGELEVEYREHDKDVTGLSDTELLAHVDALAVIGRRAAYANIVVPLLANAYRSLLAGRLSGKGIDIAEIDIIDDLEDADLDPNPHLDALADVTRRHGANDRETAAALTRFLDRFGHFSDSGNDFSVAPWRERPELVLRMAAARGAAARSGGRRPWGEVARTAGPLNRVLRRRAARYAVRRDQISSLYTYGYGLFRRYFGELGRRLAERSILAGADDIMLLNLDQVRAAIDGSLAPDQARAIAAEHRAELERVADLAMPEVIYGDDFIPVTSGATTGTLLGVASSRGHHRGPARIVNGVADFDKVEEGDVLVVPFSDVGWTPLFARAGAVVAESGGMLSHSSIVAREYGIPCVVSVPHATRLDDGVMVTVDGFRGVVHVE